MDTYSTFSYVCNAGLRLIEDDLSDEEEQYRKRASPVIPIIAPIPIRPHPGNKGPPELVSNK